MIGQRAVMASARVKGSASRDDWETPEIVLDRVRRMGPIGLDPCTTQANPTGARDWLALHHDGLSGAWSGFAEGVRFVNPPYSQLRSWLNKCQREAESGCEIVALVASRTDTRAWQSSRPNAIALWRGRLTFRGADAPAPFPSALLYWGRRVGAFAAAFEDVAQVVVPL